MSQQGADRTETKRDKVAERDEQMSNDQLTILTANLPTTGKVLVNFIRRSDSSRGRTTAKGDLQSKGRFTTLTAYAASVKAFRTKAGHISVRFMTTQGFACARAADIQSISIDESSWIVA